LNKYITAPGDKAWREADNYVYDKVKGLLWVMGTPDQPISGAPAPMSVGINCVIAPRRPSKRISARRSESLPGGRA
jgi:hypothetical protein